MKAVKLSILGLIFSFLPTIVSAQEQKPQLVIQSGHFDAVASVIFSPDGKTLASISSDGTIRLWDTSNGRELRAITTSFHGNINPGEPIAFSPDGQTIASCNHNGVELWNVIDGKKMETIPDESSANTSYLCTVKFNPNGKEIAFSTNRDIKIWNLESKKVVKILTGHTQWVTSITYSNNGELLASGCETPTGNEESTIILWRIKTEEKLKVLTGPKTSTRFVLFSPDGQTLAAAGYGSVKRWNIETYEELKPLIQNREWIYSVAFDKSGKELISSGYKSIRFWNSETGEEKKNLPAHPDTITSLAFEPEKKILVSVSYEEGMRLWNTNTDESIRITTTQTSFIDDAVVSPDGSFLASGGGNQTIRLWRLKSGQEVQTLAVKAGSLVRLQFDPDSKILASADEKGSRLWDAATGKQIPNPAKFPEWAEFTGLPTFIKFKDYDIFPVGNSGAAFKVIKFANGKSNEIATLIPIGDTDWLAVTPEGLFDGTSAALKKLIWRFENNTFNYVPVEAFFKEFYYPGLLREIMQGKNPQPPNRNVSEVDIRQPLVKIYTIANQKLESRLFDQPAVLASIIDKRQVEIAVEVTENNSVKRQAKHSATSGARDLRLFRNSLLVKHWQGDVFGEQSGCRQIQTNPGESRKAICKTTVTISAGNNDFSTYAFNDDNVKSNDSAAVVTGAKSLVAEGTLYILGIGVNQYVASGENNLDYDLKYAVADVDVISRNLAEQQSNLKQYAKIEVIKLIDKSATKDNIRLAIKRFADNTTSDLPAALPDEVKKELLKIKPISPEDALLIHFSGHGTVRCQENRTTGQTDCDRFYLIPHDGFPKGKFDDEKARLKKLYEQSISDEDLEKALETVDAGKLMMIIDACNSGQALEAEEKRRGPMNSRGLAQLAYEKGMYILTASQSRQAALEVTKLGHGLLSFALIEGLSKGDMNEDGKIIEREWFDYTVREVPQMQYEAIKTKGDIIMLESDDPNLPPEKKGLQTPRLFYRRELEFKPFLVSLLKK